MAHSTTSNDRSTAAEYSRQTRNTLHVRHVGLSTSINDILYNCMCVWSTDDSIKNRAVTSQRDQSYDNNADAVTSSPRPADHTIGEQLTDLFNLAFLPMEPVSDALQSSNMRI